MNAGSPLTRRLFLAGAALTPLALTGCGGGPAAAAPPDISYGRDTCDRCGMIISDERFAAAVTSEESEPLLFDDAGEMVETVAETGLESRYAWARDHGGAGWLDATKAVYVRGDESTTPMGTGVVAFGKRDGAASFQAEFGGEILTWDEMIASAA